MKTSYHQISDVSPRFREEGSSFAVAGETHQNSTAGTDDDSYQDLQICVCIHIERERTKEIMIDYKMIKSQINVMQQPIRCFELKTSELFFF